MKTVWLLISMDDAQELGEKPLVSVYATTQLAIDAMKKSIEEEVLEGKLEIDDIEYCYDGFYAQTRNKRFSWEISEETVYGL